MLTDDEIKTMREYGCEPWMVEQLRRNPSYTGWGRDTGPSGDHPNRRRLFADWSAFKRGFEVGKHPERLHDRSGGEIVHWKFEIDRAEKRCAECEGSGHNHETKLLEDSWYRHKDPAGRGWMHDLTQDEVDVLQAHGRLWDLCGMHTRRQLEHVVAKGILSRDEAERRWAARDTSQDIGRHDGEIFNRGVYWRDQIPAAEVNAAPSIHDSINRWICVETRARRFGVYGHCSSCEGKGSIFVEEHPRLCLVLWVLNPATGQSYDAEILSVHHENLPEIHESIRGWGKRLASRLEIADTKTARDLCHWGPGPANWWSDRSSLLFTAARYDWSSPIVERSWKRLRMVRDELETPVSPEDPRYAEFPPSWELDEVNELGAVHVEGQQLHAWVLLPRIGCSRLVTVTHFDDDDVGDIFGWIQTARNRALDRFACIPKPPTPRSTRRNPA